MRLFRQSVSLFLCALSLVASCNALSSADAKAIKSPKTPAGGIALVSEATFDTLPFRTEFGAAQTVAVTGQLFDKALRLETFKRPAQIWDLQIRANTSQPVKVGDVILVSFWMRTVRGQAETGEARTGIVFETGAPNYDKSLDFSVGVPKTWKRFDLPFTARFDSAAGDAALIFRMGFDAQSYEIADVSILNFGQKIKVDDLPRTSMTYDGQSPGAAWRKTALARIERIRKGKFTLRVLDARGKPLRGAQVSLQMMRHAFLFGSAVAADTLMAQGEDADRYRATIKSLFNIAVVENHLKWPFYETWGKADAQPSVTWLRQQKIAVRGHNLVWPSWRNSPDDLKTLANDPTQLARRVDDHIVEVAGAFKGQLIDWDVVNEPFDNHDITDILGRDALVHWFKLARKTDPHARLYLNDYPPLDGGDRNNAHLENFADTIAFLKQKGAPIDGIGFQCHFGSVMVPPTRVLSGLDRFAKFGLPIAVTEFDINTQDQKLQADYTRDFMIAAFSHPAVDRILTWGFWEGRHWLPEAALYRRDWSLKPNGQAWLDLVKKQWWTNANGKTNASGTYQTRAFYGQYRVIITLPDGRKKTLTPNFVPGKELSLQATMK